MDPFRIELIQTTSDWPDMLAITLPLLVGVMAWVFKSLAERAWGDYEVRRELYADIAIQLDALFEPNGSNENKAVERTGLLRSIRKLELLGEASVIRASNKLLDDISEQKSDLHTQNYQSFMHAMRQDLHKIRFVPPVLDSVRKSEFKIRGIPREDSDHV